MITLEQAIEIIYSVIEEYNSSVPDDDRIEKSADSVLFDPAGKLDSEGYIELSVSLEQAIERELGVILALFVDHTEYAEEKPLKTIGSTAKYIEWLINNGKGSE